MMLRLQDLTVSTLVLAFRRCIINPDALFFFKWEKGPNDASVHSICRSPNDEFHFTGVPGPLRLDFPICTPSKASRQTLADSGTFLGLSPSGKSLARLSSPSLLDQLIDKGTIKRKVWSVTLLDTESGILSLGGTIAREVEETKTRVEIELKHFGDPIATPDWVLSQVDAQMKVAMPIDSTWDQPFKWTNVQGAAGWWTALMAGVWVNGAKVRSLHRWWLSTIQWRREVLSNILI